MTLSSQTHTNPDDWYVTEWRAGNPAITVWSPLWPHDGKPGDLLYAKLTPTQGWKGLIARYEDTCHLAPFTLDQMLEMVPEQFHGYMREAHEDAIKKCEANCKLWSCRSQVLKDQLKKAERAQLSGG